MPDLKTYRAKRKPERTPEPFGEEGPERALPAGAERGFVVQQHAATRMHWDLRLEIDGVLASWSVPKGPGLDPRDRRLAVRTEDHPLEYADFEGVIPQGNYGAGAMTVWDRGAYCTVDGVSPREGLESGKLDLRLSGHKLQGRFALVRTKGDEGKSWLLLRKGEPVEDPELAEPSVLSGLTVEELAEGASRAEPVERELERLGAERRELDVRKLHPMLADSENQPFSRQGWLFELKYDGARVLASKRDGSVMLCSRSGRDATGTYPELARAIAHLPLDEFVIDGEVVSLDETGRSSFERLQRRFTQRDPQVIRRLQVEAPVVFYAFDLLGAVGRDLRGAALVERKNVLARFVPRLGFVRFADHVEGDGEALYEAARQHGLEGVIGKRADSRYETGRRSKKWLKVKVPRSSSLAIVGYLPGKGARGALGSLMLAWQRDGELIYAGNAGSGLDDQTIEELLAALETLPEPAFSGLPDPRPRGAVYARPQLVCEVRYTEVTSAGMLRHPVFLELRDDREPEDCEAPPERAAAEVAAEPEPQRPQLELTRLDKVFWPLEGYTKGDLLAYYEAVWPWLAPYLKDRPVVLTRYPDGIEGKSFYQKNAPEFTPDWVERDEIEGTDYFICNELRTLLYVINSGAIPLHVWSARRGELDKPDWLILDLDPKQAPFSDVVRVARHIHRLLEGLETPHFAKTSGQDGLHVMVPLAAQLHHSDAKVLGEVLARVVCTDLPDIATIARPLAARGDKVYVDFLQNGRGKLIAAPFSVRPRVHAPVSMPLSWSQVSARLDPTRWNMATGPRSLRERGDPMLPLLDESTDVEGLLAALSERLTD